MGSPAKDAPLASGGLLQDQVALVLGGGSIAKGLGIGRALCLAYAREGATVVVADIHPASAEETVAAVAEQGGRARSLAVDVLDDEALAAACGEVEGEAGRIDILHCNVGLGQSGPSEQTDPATFRRICDANLVSLHTATQAVLPGMRKRRRGAVLVTTSVAGLRWLGHPHLAYGATKAAAAHFVRLLALEHADANIRANAIAAGLIDTPRVRQTMRGAYGEDPEAFAHRRAAQVPLGRMGSPWDVAEAAVFLASERAAYITGIELVVDGGLTVGVREAPG